MPGRACPHEGLSQPQAAHHYRLSRSRAPRTSGCDKPWLGVFQAHRTPSTTEHVQPGEHLIPAALVTLSDSLCDIARASLCSQSSRGQYCCPRPHARAPPCVQHVVTRHRRIHRRQQGILAVIQPRGIFLIGCGRCRFGDVVGG